MRILYPDIKPFATHQLDVGDGHSLYVEESGSVNGLPVLYIHGGPGTGSASYHRRFFNPSKYRIILFDQRGCGQSQAEDLLANNTTQDLLSDIDVIRNFLNIKQWMLFGGGWGAMLSLLYAQTHPENVCGMLLHSIFLGRQKDIDWIFKNGAPRLLPDYWHEFLSQLRAEPQDNILELLSERLNGDDELARMSTAKGWAKWYAKSSLLHQSNTWIKRFLNPHIAIATAQLQTHYFRQNCFLDDYDLLEESVKLTHIPGTIIHGRFDLICPFDCAQTLSQYWPAAELQVIHDAGHANLDPALTDALVRATKDLHKMITNDWTDTASD